MIYGTESGAAATGATRKRATRQCRHPGVKSNGAQGATERRAKRTGGKRCAEPGCPKGALGATEYCARHGGGKRCAEEGCGKQALGATVFCARHGGGKRCAEPGCRKGALGATVFCIRHGGGKRCTEPGCPKAALGATEYCARHGGGKRCAEEGCGKSAQGATEYCIRHGGGLRCAEPGCRKQALGATEYCSFHGGGKRCAEEGCPRGAVGATEHCVVHGGGKRCPNCATWPDSRCGQSKYDGHCATCFKRVFPSDPRSKVIYAHTKEIRVRNELNDHFDGFVHDTPLYTGGCDCTHRRRVDHRKLVDGTLLCIETDEHAHAGYDARDEEIRYDDLYMVYSGRWIFIRFNPDGRGVDMEDKLARLMEEVETQIGRIERSENTEPVEIIKLFY